MAFCSPEVPKQLEHWERFWATPKTAFGLKEVQRRGEWWLRERGPYEQCWTAALA